jgi:hypothetical protein
MQKFGCENLIPLKKQKIQKGKKAISHMKLNQYISDLIPNKNQETKTKQKANEIPKNLLSFIRIIISLQRKLVS